MSRPAGSAARPSAVSTTTAAKSRSRRADFSASAGALNSLHILRLAVAERPVFRKRLDEVDEDILGTQAGACGQFRDDAPVKLLLLGGRAGVADRKLDVDEIVAALDAEIVRVVDEIVLVMFGQDHEAVAVGYVEGLPHRLIETLENGLAVDGGLAPAD